MHMSKRIGSIVLLCLTVIMLLLTVVICVNMGLSFYQMDNHVIDTSCDMLPGASILAVAFTTISVWVGFLFFGGCAAAVGWISSLINTKIACSPAIRAVSVGFLCIFSAVLVIVFAAGCYLISCIV